MPPKDVWDKVYVILTGFLVGAAFATLIAVWRQAVETKKAAEATKESAQAARDNIAFLINKERARIMVSVYRYVPEPPAYFAGSRFRQEIGVRVVSYGATDAFITDATADVRISQLPSHVAFTDRPVNLPPVLHPSLDKGTRIDLELEMDLNEIDALQKKALFMHLHGSIKYRDIFGAERETRFRYLWQPEEYTPENNSVRLSKWIKSGSPEENSET
jgi:hypothetical protein